MARPFVQDISDVGDERHVCQAAFGKQTLAGVDIGINELLPNVG